MATVLKTVRAARLSWVRILHPPPANFKGARNCSLFLYNTCDPKQFAGFNRKCPILAAEKGINFAITLGINIVLFVVFFVFLYKVSQKAFNFNTLDSNEGQTAVLT